MNQKTPSGVWNPKKLLERLFLVENDAEVIGNPSPAPNANPRAASSGRAESPPRASELELALARLGGLDLPDGARFMLDFSTAAKHFGSDWQTLKATGAADGHSPPDPSLWPRS